MNKLYVFFLLIFSSFSHSYSIKYVTGNVPKIWVAVGQQSDRDKFNSCSNSNLDLENLKISCPLINSKILKEGDSIDEQNNIENKHFDFYFFNSSGIPKLIYKALGQPGKTQLDFTVTKNGDKYNFVLTFRAR